MRGAGRQHGVFVSERLLDFAARELGIDRVEIRKRNLLAPDRFPHNHEIMFQDSAPLVYDSGNYLPTLEQAAEMIGYEQFRRDEQPRLRKEGRHVGLGIVCYVEGTGIGPYEGARVTVEPSGTVRVATGVGTQGQGHFTVLAQIVADVLGVERRGRARRHRRHARVQLGHRHVREPRGGRGGQRVPRRGAGGSREGAGTWRAVAARRAGRDTGARQRPRSGRRRARARDRAGRAGRARRIRCAARSRPGTEPGLESTAYFGPDRGSTANGVHAMIVEVDPETAAVEIKRYLVVHDCGTIINPLLVEGQIHGGVAHGIGNAFYESLVYDEQAQLLNASFMDYLLPTATDVPPIETAHRETPSPFNVLGLKGVGEAGCIPTGAAFAQAVEDALAGRRPRDPRDSAQPEPALRDARSGDADHDARRQLHVRRSASRRLGSAAGSRGARQGAARHEDADEDG